MSNSQLSHNTTLSIYDEPKVQRANRIICTIRHATQSVEGLKGLIDAGMSVVRMNFSHGEHSYHETTIVNARQAAKEKNAIIAIALDTKGPEIRTGLFVGGKAELKRGQKIIVTTDPAF